MHRNLARLTLDLFSRRPDLPIYQAKSLRLLWFSCGDSWKIGILREVALFSNLVTFSTNVGDINEANQSLHFRFFMNS